MCHGVHTCDAGHDPYLVHAKSSTFLPELTVQVHHAIEAGKPGGGWQPSSRKGDWLGRIEMRKRGFTVWGWVAGGGHPASALPPLCPQELKSLLVTGPRTEALGLMSPPAVEPCTHVGAAGLESLPLVGASPAGSPSSPRDLPEPRVTTEHTNNRIGESACVGVLAWSGLRGQWGDGCWAPGPHLEVGTLGLKGPRRGLSHGLVSGRCFW